MTKVCKGCLTIKSTVVGIKRNNFIDIYVRGCKGDLNKENLSTRLGYIFTRISCTVFILSLKVVQNSICCVLTWVRGEKTGWDGGGVLSAGLVLNVTGKIGKAFNMMQYLSNHPIKIRPNQSLLPGQAGTTHSHQGCWTSFLQRCIMFTYNEWNSSFFKHYLYFIYLFSLTQVCLWYKNSMALRHLSETQSFRLIQLKCTDRRPICWSHHEKTNKTKTEFSKFRKVK